MTKVNIILFLYPQDANAQFFARKINSSIDLNNVHLRENMLFSQAIRLMNISIKQTIHNI